MLKSAEYYMYNVSVFVDKYLYGATTIWHASCASSLRLFHTAPVYTQMRLGNLLPVDRDELGCTGKIRKTMITLSRYTAPVRRRDSVN